MTERKIALSIEEAADYTGIGRNTLRKLVEWKKLTLNERLNSENRAGNIQALKNDLRKTKRIVAERERENARCRNHDRGMSR